ncbi:MAG: alanine acetyltransferase [Cyanobacteria bacterium QS_7_48_42]|nr:MAG: alanine acetyltransferase [Cyanobacteria bacterium QH_10_48_56]PSO58399.1 MAG: alanine acetyltransferase [Cyanobacteria bacterium QH_7_48_89]PSO68200.1 MAG: alanine acetyltransferase [Cyanobacteria bacterium QS_1_48_34]PSO86860.1 MAG: alanine acetyltransferase [Cyanobacteria bacterium QS_5_48_63]PSO91352.1 MAG: alanine acetyltransferase [Cyanobacteria bacterium QS_3_48_167]PSO93117.1 MAG: alanine acetyltransferase [Cyanobacteria bacterium QS_6_48_18]PSO93358.1 MAG: alanine acetyltrans
MLLKGSCHCGAVHFSVQSYQPYPFMHCYCSICRKTAGGGGYAINLAGDNRTLEVEGSENITVYRARFQNPEHDQPRQSEGERRFCRHCGSFLWVYDPNYPELMHPFTSAIDTDLPKPPERTHIMLDFAANWVEIPETSNDYHHRRYPHESLADWHERLGLTNEAQD